MKNKLTGLDFEYNLNEFIENIEFERIHQVMELLDWKWLNEFPYDVPSIERMKAWVNHYLIESINGAIIKLNEKPKKKKVTFHMATGGFFYTATVYRDTPKVYLDVKFSIAELNNYD